MITLKLPTNQKSKLMSIKSNEEKLMEIIKEQQIMIKNLIQALRDLRQEEGDESCSCPEQHLFASYLMELANEIAHTEITDEYKSHVLYNFTQGLLSLTQD